MPYLCTHIRPLQHEYTKELLHSGLQRSRDGAGSTSSPEKEKDDTGDPS